MDKFTVFNTMGEADVAASANAYAKALTTWKSENEVPVATVEAAVEAVFDRTPGARLSTPALINFAVNELSQDPNAFKSLNGRVRAYINGQKLTGRLSVVQGKFGGCQRLALPGQPIPVRVAKTA